MKIVQNNTQVTKLFFTDPDIIEQAETDHFFITQYPSIKQYGDFIGAAAENDAEKLDKTAQSMLKCEDGTPLLKNPTDIIPHAIYEHILMKMTEYLLKSKTKRSTQLDQAGQSNT